MFYLNSFQRTSLFFCFIMMDELQNGTSLSGQSGLFMWVFANRQNGKTQLALESNKIYQVQSWDDSDYLNIF